MRYQSSSESVRKRPWTVTGAVSSMAVAAEWLVSGSTTSGSSPAIGGYAISSHGVVAQASFVAREAMALGIIQLHGRIERRADAGGHHVAGHYLAGLGGEDEAIDIALAGDLAIDDDRQRDPLGARRLGIRLSLDELRQVAHQERPHLRSAPTGGGSPETWAERRVGLDRKLRVPLLG